MAVSAGLQKYFNGRRKKRSDIDEKLKKISDDIDPKFLSSFQDFRSRILDIVEEEPSIKEILGDELDELEENIETSKRSHNLKKASALIQISEKI